MCITYNDRISLSLFFKIKRKIGPGSAYDMSAAFTRVYAAI